MLKLLRLRTVGGGRVWRLGVGLDTAFREGIFPGFCGTGEIGEMKKPSQACLLQIFSIRILLGWSKGCVEGKGVKWDTGICVLEGVSDFSAVY